MRSGTWRGGGVAAFCTRHFAILAAAVLGLAAFNLVYRIDAEVVTQWDEALYANTAWEIHATGRWIGTTLFGVVDYYNAKPPLNVWLIALAFNAFGVSLGSLRLVSVASAWVTVAVLMLWLRRALGPAPAVFAGVVLATCFGFVHVHSGRSANPDALFTLLMLLTVVTLWAARANPWMRAWLGPLLAAAFLLRGLAVLMPLSVIVAVEVCRWRAVAATRRHLHAMIVGLVLFAVPVGAWGVARWHFDGWQFLGLVADDALGHALRPLEGHSRSPLYYLDVLQRNHYDWLVAFLVAWGVSPLPWPRVRHAARVLGSPDGIWLVIGCWATATLLIPSLMQTRLPWYLNTFYPVFACAVGGMLARAFSRTGGISPGCRVLLGVTTVVALAVAESKLVWYSFEYRDLRTSMQGLVLAEKERLNGSRVFTDEWLDADAFVVSAVVGADRRTAGTTEEFLRTSVPGDYLIRFDRLADPRMVAVRSNGRATLFVRGE